jgi:1-acyl-sn-glycerol-3-phosphate acyltransferase
LRSDNGSIILIGVRTRNQQPTRPAGPGFITNIWHALGLLFWVVFLRGFNRIEVRNPENRPGRTEFGVLICGNHISAVDPFVVAASAMPFFSPVWWRAPAKEELFRIPVLRSMLRTWGAFPVRRGKGDREVMESMVRLLRTSVIVIFPEGTRSPDGRLQPGRAGVGKIIYDARPAKVIPVSIRGSDRLLPRGRVVPRLFRTMTIAYGLPLDLSQYYAREDSVEVSQAIVDEVMRAIDRLQSSVS